MIYILRKKSDKLFCGYTESQSFISTENPDMEYIAMDFNKEEKSKLIESWHIKFNQRGYSFYEPESVKQQRLKKENDKIMKKEIKTKLENDTITLEDIKKALKILL